jgi:tRNA pseudouridine38-40 synthase
MVRKFRLILEYDGAAFNGWQTQSLTDGKGQPLRTLQSHLEDKLEKMFKRKTHCHASGRTDSGVHAIGQVAHFKADTHLTPKIIHRALNSFLDKDLSIVKVQEVPLEFDAQYSAKGKTYRYTILNRPHPSALWRQRAWFYPEQLNISAMRKAAGFIKGKHDFKAFQSASERSKTRSTIRTVSKLSIVKEGDLIHITISADGFLYKMVRNIVGTLALIGSGKESPDLVLKIFKSKDRKLSPKSAPANGLCLMSVKY